MSDTVASHPALPEVAYPAGGLAARPWPWMLFGFALLALIYFVGVDEGAPR